MMMRNILADIRYGARAIKARPTFAVVIILTLALGIGVNVAILSLTEQILLRPLPVPEPDRLVNLTSPGSKTVVMTSFPTEWPSRSGGSDTLFSYPMFRDLERAQRPFVRLAAHTFFEARLASQEVARLATGVFVSGSYFPLLGLRPTLGRLIGPEDDRIDGQAESVVLSEEYWQSEFAGDPGVLGRTLLVNDVRLSIVGVAPRGFHGTAVGANPSVFVPITFTPPPDENMHASLQPLRIPNHDSRNNYWVHIFGRLEPGVTREAAAAAMNPLYRGIVSEVEVPLLKNVNENQREAFRTRPLVLEPGASGQTRREILSSARTSLQLLLALSGLVLLLCCANVVGLMLLRTTARGAEMAVRSAMGATKTRVASLLLTESLVLALPAALMSLPIASLVLRGARGVPGISEAGPDVSLSGTAALVAVGIAVVSALAVGFLPIRGLVRTDPGKTLHASGVRRTTAKGVARFRATVATAQVALSMALLAMTAVCAQSLMNIARLDLGADINSVVMFSVPPPNGITTDAAFLTRLAAGLDAIPGVSSTAWSSPPLFAREGRPVFEGTVEGVDAKGVPVASGFVSLDFFRTFGIKLIAGREFIDSDVGQVTIVSQRYAERFGLSPEALIGRKATFGPLSFEIIGVVADVRFGKITGEIEPQSYLLSAGRASSRGSAPFYVRGDRPPEELMRAVREAVARVSPTRPITNLRTMEQQLRDNVANERFLAGASMAFALLATVLAALGLYGVLAYSVTQRSREIGLRVALGAPASRIRGMVLRQVAGMAMIGVALGVFAAWLLGRATRNLLFGVEAGDPLALIAAAAVLAAVMLGAAYIPARRASRVDPMTALRYE
jgi:putative ABC transport system permease protein